MGQRASKPCLPVLLPGTIHQQTLAQEALAVLSTETSELEIGCCLCSKRGNVRPGEPASPGSLSSTCPCLVCDNKRACFFAGQHVSITVHVALLWFYMLKKMLVLSQTSRAVKIWQRCSIFAKLVHKVKYEIVLILFSVHT